MQKMNSENSRSDDPVDGTPCTSHLALSSDQSLREEQHIQQQRPNGQALTAVTMSQIEEEEPYTWSCTCGDLVLAVPRVAVSDDHQSCYCCNRLFTLPFFARTRVFVVWVQYAIMALVGCLVALLLYMAHNHVTVLMHNAHNGQPPVWGLYTAQCMHNYTQMAHSFTTEVTAVKTDGSSIIRTVPLPSCQTPRPHKEKRSTFEWTEHLLSMCLLVGDQPAPELDTTALLLVVLTLCGIPICVFALIRASACLLSVVAVVYFKDWLPGKAIDIETANDNFPRARVVRTKTAVDLPYLLLLTLLVLITALSPLVLMWLETVSYAYALFYLLINTIRLGYQALPRLSLAGSAFTIMFVVFVWLLLIALFSLVRLKRDRLLAQMADQIVLSQASGNRPQSTDQTTSEHVYENYLKKHSMMRLMINDGHRERLAILQNQVWHSSNVGIQTDLYSTVDCSTETDRVQLCDAINQSNRVRAPVPPKHTVIIKQPTLFNYDQTIRYFGNKT